MANIMELKHLGSKNGLISHTHTHTQSLLVEEIIMIHIDSNSREGNNAFKFFFF